jgi:hypothetical protein
MESDSNKIRNDDKVAYSKEEKPFLALKFKKGELKQYFFVFFFGVLIGFLL